MELGTQRDARTIYWEALEHTRGTRGGDWYWSLGILSIAAAVAAIAFGNILFAIVILLAAVTLAVFALRGPSTFAYTVGPRGIRINDELYPYSTLESFYLDEDAPGDVELLLKTQHTFAPLIVVPVPEEYVDIVDQYLNERLLEEYLEEPFLNKLFELVGL
jgi:hypothetical protein